MLNIYAMSMRVATRQTEIALYDVPTKRPTGRRRWFRKAYLFRADLKNL